ncbi:MAG: hypothetical protein O2820_11910 [Planctomycetota bacterium]|nr:hypothetical protein [Planctomycetota bacterium]MDA1249915.1 hypothetical protein [Planctomycetota bacterium]
MTCGLNFLLIAHESSPELPSLRETILSFTGSTSAESSGRQDSLRVVSSLGSTLSDIKDGLFPDLVVVYQGVPDEFAQSQIDELIGLLPLARFVITFGPWCESIGRTEQRWPIAWCVPIRHLAARLQRELAGFAAGETTPPTATRDEAFSQSAARVGSCQSETELSATVSGDDRHFVETVRDQLIASGMTVTDGSDRPDCIFLTASLLSPRTESELARLKREFPAAEFFLLCDLLTPGQIERLISDGVTPMSQLRFGAELVELIAAQQPRRGRPSHFLLSR